MNPSNLTPLQRAACNLYAGQTGATPEMVELALANPAVGSVAADFARSTLTGPYGSFIPEDEVIDASIDGYLQGLRETVEAIDNLVIGVATAEAAQAIHEVLNVVKNDILDRIARFDEGTDDLVEVASGTDAIAEMLSSILGYPVTVARFEQAPR